MKFCRKCLTEKSISEFGNNKNEKDGKHRYCKKCNNKDRRDNYNKYHKKRPQPKEGHYFCAICKVEKLLVDFAIDRSKKNGRHCYCRQCLKDRRTKRKTVTSFICSQCYKKKDIALYNDFAICSPCLEHIKQTGVAKKINERILNFIT